SVANSRLGFASSGQSANKGHGAGHAPGFWGFLATMSEIEGRIAALPIWSGPVALVPLAGGISNQSFTATDSAGKYVVRITRDFPFHHVFRDREVMSARAAHTAGFAPEVVHAEPGLMVSRFIDGKVLTTEDVQA